MFFLPKAIFFLIFFFLNFANADVIPMPGIVFANKQDIIYPKTSFDNHYQASQQANPTASPPNIAISTLTPEQITAINNQPLTPAVPPAIPINQNNNSTPADAVPKDTIVPPVSTPINSSIPTNASLVNEPTTPNSSLLPILPSNINSPKYHKSNIANSNNNSLSPPINKNNFTVIGSEGSKTYALPPILPPPETPIALPVVPPSKVINKLKMYQINDEKSTYSVVETMSAKQKAAQQANLPENALKISENIGWRRQILPPNISQKVYVKSNQHLIPVVFQSDIDSVAFKYTSNSNDIDLLRALLHRITNVDIQDQEGNTLLIYSVYNNNYDAIILLLHYGANPNLYNDAGFGPLHLAASIGDEKMIALLLGYGAEVNVIDSTGSTPIMYACLVSDNLIGVKNLVYYGSNIDILNNNGLNAIDFAKSNPNREILGYMNNI